MCRMIKAKTLSKPLKTMGYKTQLPMQENTNRRLLAHYWCLAQQSIAPYTSRILNDMEKR